MFFSCHVSYSNADVENKILLGLGFCTGQQIKIKSQTVEGIGKEVMLMMGHKIKTEKVNK